MSGSMEGEQVTDYYSYASPAMELVYESGTAAFRGQWPAIEEGLELVRPIPNVGDWPKAYLSLPGKKSMETLAAEEAATPFPPERDVTLPTGLFQDRPDLRVRMLDDHGVDRQLVGPGVPMIRAGHLESHVAAGLFGAYNQYLIGYCGASPERLRAIIVVHGGEPQWSAREIRDLAGDPCVGGVAIFMPVRVGPDTRDFQQIWKALDQVGLPLIHRPGFSSDVWSNRRLSVYLAASGILGGNDELRVVLTGSTAAELAELVPEKINADSDVTRELHRAFQSGQLRVSVRDQGNAAVARVSDDFGGVLWHSDFPFAQFPGESSRNGDVRGARELAAAETDSG